MKKILSAVAILLAAFLVASCAKQPEAPAKNRYSATFIELFDTASTIIGYDADKESFTAFAEGVKAELLEYHKLYDIYNSYEGIVNIKTLNETAALAPVKVDGRIVDLLKYSKYIYEVTQGKTNIAFGAVLQIWHNYREDGINSPENSELPPMETLREAAAHTDINDIIIDEENCTVFFADPLLRLDVGAIAKGYATEMAAKRIIAQGRTDVLLSIGGNVRALGAKPDGSAWVVGIENPDKYAEEASGESLFRLEITSGSVVTSGDYERYYTVDGVRYHHIIDPETLMPAAYYRAVSVLTEDSGLADGLSTGLFCLPYEQARALADSLPGVDVCQITPDGEIRQTDGYAAHVQKNPE
ncbi:MAG: FAD:protein FMN transferase [Oscillospiraceae bacterium]|jgi:thiamine biosynthesis lipoprotein|nr:FAD:protein FMN transferase [Oscillospiraceae bacterium]